MAGWHHQLHGHEFQQPLGDGEGQETLPGEQCRGVCWNSDLGKEKQADGENKRILMSWSATVLGVTKSQT